MINLMRLELHNFLSHKDSIINLTDYDGLTLIEGKTEDGRYSSNGSGKSTILEGIYYALTGKTLRGLTADSVVNRVVGRDTCVYLEFTLHRDHYEIYRYRKHHESQNDVKVYKNSEDISSRLPTETQRTIDSLVNLPQEILSGVMILGEGLTSRFTQLPDPAKKSLLENTVRLSHDLSSAKEETKSELSSIVTSISYAQGAISANNNLIKEYESVDTSEIEQVRSRVQSLQTDLSTMQSNCTNLSDTIQSLNHKIQILETAKQQYSVLSREEGTLRTEESNLKSQLEMVMSSLPRCPLCHQTLGDPAEVRSKIQGSLMTNAESLQRVSTEMSKLPSIDMIETKLSGFYNELGECQSSHRGITSQMVQVTTEISNLQKVITVAEEKDRVLADTRHKNEVLSSELTSLSKKEEVLKYLDKNVFSPTGVIVYILGNVVKYVDSRLQVYNNLLLDKTFHLTFKKGKISIEGTSDSTYQSLSNGEKRRLDISIQFALHDYIYTHCGIGFDTLFIDEVLDTLDTVGVSNIIEVLSMKKSYCSLSRIFVVTHNDELKDYFDSVLSVSKGTDGLTYIL